MRSWPAIAVVLAAALVVPAGCASGDKAGGHGGVTTLSLATPDTPGRAGSRAAELFAREVRRRSHGRLRVRIVYESDVAASGAFRPAWDQHVAEQVRHGDHELGMVPARAWDVLGVRTLQPLQAPFVLTTREATAAVVTSSLVPELLAGLDRAGVVGLGLVPEGLRHPVAFGRPLRTLADFRGAVLRTPRSALTSELLRALGARAADLNGDAFTAAVLSGEVTGAESELALAPALPRPGVVTTDVTFFPKVDALVIGAPAFRDLDGGERSVLRAAAAATTARAVRDAPTDAAAAALACRVGVRLTTAAPGALDALRRAAAPVLRRLERDPATRDLLARVRELAAQAASRPVELPACAGDAATPVRVAHDGDADPGVLNGVYRYRLGEQELIDGGAEPGWAFHNYGVQTITLRDGRVRLHTDETRFAAAVDCLGSYQLDDAGWVEVAIHSPDCSGHFRFSFTLRDDVLRVSRIQSLPPYDGPQDRVDDRLLFARKPWRRIARVASSAPRRIPDGAYRALVTERELVRAGIPPDEAYYNAGLQTLTIRGDRFRAATRSPADPADCTGDLAYTGGRAVFTADPTPDCGTAAGEVLLSARWTRTPEGLRFDAVDAAAAVAALFGGRRWRAIG